MKKIETFCPVRNVLAKIGDKWSALVLTALEQNEIRRFSELQRDIPDVSQKMLVQTLRSLENFNLIDRKIYPEVPPRVEYKLTELGSSLMPQLDSLIEWIMANKDALNTSCPDL